MIGQSVQRLEDPALVTGEGTYIPNLRVPGLLYAAFVRSTVAHGTIASIDSADASAMPGVVAIETGEGIGVAPSHGFVPLGDAFKRPALSAGTVRFVGEAVAIVIAETKAQAEDAAEAVVVDYDVLDHTVDPEEALAPDAPVLFAELGNNAAVLRGDHHEVDFDGAVHVARARIVNQRMAVVPMEPNCMAALPRDDGAITVYAATQMPHLLRGQIAGVFELAPDKVRVIAPHVGGGFGGKVGMAPEFAAVIAMAQRLQRPITWVETRSEDLVSLSHGRAQVQFGELGVDADGHFTGLRVRLVADAGAYPGMAGMLPMSTKLMSSGVYRIPAIQVDIASAATNTTPIGAYRGAGRPEATALLERLVDIAAHDLDIDPAELRRRNLIAADEFPYTTVTHATYDSGEYAKALDAVLELAGYEELRAEQRRRREADGRHQLGIGLSTYVEVTAGGGSSEFASVRIEPDGGATISVGTSAHGQGHATSFAQIVNAQLGIPIDRIRFVQSDTDLVPRGGGTGGSRSLQVGGTAVHRASEQLLDTARRLAGHLLEANPDDIVVNEDGSLGVAGAPGARTVAWAELYDAASRGNMPPGVSASSGAEVADQVLAAAVDVTQAAPTFPFGAHVSVVEVDMDTGEARVLRHVAVDDCGMVVNPMLVAGQQHGGIAAGVGQALFEQVVYDESGNPLTGTLVDYAIPTAAELPSFEVASQQTPTPLNPLGAKGIGEAGTIGATPAVQNAVVDAVSHLGVRHIDMPCTPERVWQAITAARNGGTGDAWREPPAIFATIDRTPPGEAEEAVEI